MLDDTLPVEELATLRQSHGKIKEGTYYETFVKCQDATLGFFRDIGEYHQELSSLMTDNVRIIKI